jgi:DNA-binding Lrp family transcriptional regulator
MKPREVKVVDELRKDSRRSLTEISNNADMPLSTVFKAVNRLYKREVITKNACLVDFAQLGFPYKVGIFLTTDKKEDLKEFLAEHLNLNSLLRLSGDYEFYAELIFKDMAAFQDFADELKEAQLIKKISMHFVTDVKQEEFTIRGEK